ncbi:MAG: enoyl-CoA hydratase/isomerase family protein [Acidimicrobiales bacterium]|nr:enoyl-CoA hydratase/isomerase family protein [Acidimicrobiales bacterium]
MADTPSFENLSITVEGNIAQLVLNRPAKMNALSTSLLEELAQAARWFDTVPEVKAVVVSGAGKHFSAGADLEAFTGPAATDIRKAADAGRLMAEAIEEMTAPAVAAITGWCVGGGLVLAAACDLRVADDDARFSIPEVDLGIPLAWGGIPRLVREIGPAATKELVMTCRTFDATEARSLGFLNKTVPADQVLAEASNLANELAKRPALAISVTKRHVNAVTSQMVGTARSWSDADGLITSLHDPGCQQARLDYLKERNR